METLHTETYTQTQDRERCFTPCEGQPSTDDTCSGNVTFPSLKK